MKEKEEAVLEIQLRATSREAHALWRFFMCHPPPNGCNGVDLTRLVKEITNQLGEQVA